MQIVSEDRGLTLDKAQPEMLGTAKKVCILVVGVLAFLWKTLTLITTGDRFS